MNAHWLPAPLHRGLLGVAHTLRRLWWRWARPALEGVSLVLFDRAGRVLLVRHSYGTRRWTLPGGGLGRGEVPEAAAARELAEELGCALALSPAGVIEEQLHGTPNRVHLFAGTLESLPTPDGREVIEARFFPLDDLPGDCSAIVSPRLARLEQR